MTNIERFNLISKEYVTTQEIMLIQECGYDKANDIRKEIENKYCDGWSLPKYKIPTEFLLKKLKIDIKKVYEKAKLEKELKGGE